MSRDLEQLLHDTAVEPSQPLSPARLIARARQRRRRRAASGAAAVAAAAVAAVVGVTLGLGPSERPLEIVDQPPAPEEPGVREPDVPEPDDLGEADHGEAGADAGVATVALGEVDRALLVFGPDGIRRIDAGQDGRIWGGPVVTALPDLRGGAVFQETDPDDPDVFGDRVRWLPVGADAPAPTIGPSDDHVTLHAVAEIGGEPTVLFTRRTGDGEDEVETLYAHGLDSGTERELGVTGALESGLGGAGVADDRLVLARCHLHCQLFVVPPGSPLDGDDVTELLPGAMPIQGLDVAQGVAAYVELPPPAGVGDEDGEPVLWLHDIDGGDRRDLALPTPDVDIAAVAVTVDLAPDGAAALIAFRPGGDPTRVRTLYVDDLDTEPRLRWLDTGEHVRFDLPENRADDEDR